MLVMRLIVSNLFTALFICLTFLTKRLHGERLSAKYHYYIWFLLLPSLGMVLFLLLCCGIFLHRRCFMKVSQHLPSEGELMIYTSVFSEYRSGRYHGHSYRCGSFGVLCFFARSVAGRSSDRRRYLSARFHPAAGNSPKGCISAAAPERTLSEMLSQSRDQGREMGKYRFSAVGSFERSMQLRC